MVRSVIQPSSGHVTPSPDHRARRRTTHGRGITIMLWQVPTPPARMRGAASPWMGTSGRSLDEGREVKGGRIGHRADREALRQRLHSAHERRDAVSYRGN